LFTGDLCVPDKPYAAGRPYIKGQDRRTENYAYPHTAAY
jgi:hypothetical protein